MRSKIYNEHHVPRKYYFDFENKSPMFVDIYVQPIRTITLSDDFMLGELGGCVYIIQVWDGRRDDFFDVLK